MLRRNLRNRQSIRETQQPSPSSKVTCFKFDLAAISWVLFPVPTLSVKATLCILVWHASNAPGGNPAWATRAASPNAANGVFYDGLRMKQLPVANSAGAFIPIDPIGLFHGMMPAVTPRGSFWTILRNPPSCGKDSPVNFPIQPL